MTSPAAEVAAGTDAAQDDLAGQPTGDGEVDPAAQTGGDTPDGAEQDETDWQAEAEKWRNLARKHERTAKDNSAAARRLKDIEDANKTELQRAQEAQAEAERQRDEALTTHAQIMAAAAYDVPPDLIPFLGSGTAEEIDERAETLSNVIKASATSQARQIVEAMGLQWPGTNGQPMDSRTAAGAAALAAGTARGRPVESLAPGALPGRGQGPVTKEQQFRELLLGGDQ